MWWANGEFLWIEWQLMSINEGYGDYTGWHFDGSGGLRLNSSNFSGWLGKFIHYSFELVVS